jgi:hypothetical protein
VSTYDFERTLRDQMKAHAAELDRMLGPAPQLRALLSDQRTAGRPRRFTSFRLSLAVAAVAAATVAIVVLVLIFGSPLAQPLPDSSPLSSVTPSALPLVTFSSLPSMSPAVPTNSPPPTVSAGVPTVLVRLMQGDGILWASGGDHTASIWR